MLGDEGHAPYQRPPLSKAFLKGEMEEARLTFKPEKFFDDQQIDRQFDAAAETLDTTARTVTCSNGDTYKYDRLVIATGATPIELPIAGGSLPGVYALRGLDDSKAIRESLQGAQSVVVIGGGYIGLEVAAAARQLGHDVTVIERLPRLLSRVTTPPVSDFYLKLHQERGVDVRLEESVIEIEGDDSVTGVKLESGESIPAQLVLVGIGVHPNQELAEAAGIECADGILVDEHCRTSIADVYAAGDCARAILGDDRTLRLESVHNAIVQAERIAADIVGDEAPAYDPPWFWSDQYEFKLQTVGLFNDHDDIVIRGNMDEKKFSALYFCNNELIAVDSINDPVTFMAGKQILKQELKVDRETASDPATSLKDLVPRRPRKAATP